MHTISKPLLVTLISAVWTALVLGIQGFNEQSLSLLFAGIALALWLSESVTVFVPTFLLIAGSLLTHTLIGGGAGEVASTVDPAKEIFRKMADPVLGLFFCGMTLGIVLRKYRVDHFVAQGVHRVSRGSPLMNLRISMIVTAGFAMWTTNSTAMAICLPAFGATILEMQKQHPRQAKGSLVALAMAANFGGMLTPIGTAPNAIVLSALSSTSQISFAHWMAIMLPLGIALLIATEILTRTVFSFSAFRNANSQASTTGAVSPRLPLHLGATALFCVTVLLWLTEPLHGVHPLAIGFGSAAVAFGSGLLEPSDLAKIDWDVLLLIAGGLLLGFLLERGQVLEWLTQTLQNPVLSFDMQLGILVLLAAVGSAISSNTATAIVLVPIALRLAPAEPAAAAIAVAAGCSLGVPFTISTPANALVCGRHGVGNPDLMKVGLPLMIGGCLFVALTAPWFVRFWMGGPAAP